VPGASAVASSTCPISTRSGTVAMDSDDADEARDLLRHKNSNVMRAVSPKANRTTAAASTAAATVSIIDAAWPGCSRRAAARDRRGAPAINAGPAHAAEPCSRARYASMRESDKSAPGGSGPVVRVRFAERATRASRR
jgi:hypothetical protein